MNNTIQHRGKIETSVRILKPDQAPLKFQDVTIQQIKHKFIFGTAAFDLLPLTNGEYKGKQREEAEVRGGKMLALCNGATLPFYWARFEPVRGKPMTEQVKRAAVWCKDHDLTVKGHPLCWHTLTADWLLSMNNEAILESQLNRIRRDVFDFSGLINMWDVINEPVIMPIFTRYENGISRLCRELGRIQTIKILFEVARAENPSAVLLINDFDTSPAYDILIEDCLAEGIKIDAIGIQSHMHQGYWGIEKTLEILERFSRFHLPIHFTETTLVSGHLMPPEIVDLNDYQVTDWPTTTSGEERQAREVIQHYQTLFTHPLVESITWWDLFDGGWLNAPGGLLRKDGSSKPAYEELLKRVKGEWWVSPKRLSTDGDGNIRITGYPGEYEVACGKERWTIRLEDGESQTMELVMESV